MEKKQRNVGISLVKQIQEGIYSGPWFFSSGLQVLQMLLPWQWPTEPLSDVYCRSSFFL